MYKALTKDYFLTSCNLPEDYVVDGVIINGSGDRNKQLPIFQSALENFSVVEEKNIDQPFFSRIQVYKINDKRIWFDVVYGSAYLSELLHVACMLGSKKNIFTGSVGGLFRSGKSGDIIVPTYSFGDESSTRMYQRDIIDSRHYPDKALSDAIANNISKEFTVLRGPLMTCQAMLGETQEDVARWSEEGYYGVEMETATFFAVSNHFNVPSAALLYVTDNLIEGEVVGSETHVNSKALRDAARFNNYKLALETLIK